MLTTTIAFNVNFDVRLIDLATGVPIDAQLHLVMNVAETPELGSLSLSCLVVVVGAGILWRRQGATSTV